MLMDQGSIPFTGALMQGNLSVAYRCCHRRGSLPRRARAKLARKRQITPRKLPLGTLFQLSSSPAKPVDLDSDEYIVRQIIGCRKRKTSCRLCYGLSYLTLRGLKGVIPTPYISNSSKTPKFAHF